MAILENYDTSVAKQPTPPSPTQSTLMRSGGTHSLDLSNN